MQPWAPEAPARARYKSFTAAPQGIDNADRKRTW
jgi:hypothetical protein